MAASTAEQRTLLEEKLSAASDWIYEEGHDATEEVLNAKLKELKDITNPIQKRKDEAAKRPEAVKGLRDALDQLSKVTDMVKEQIKVAAEASSKAAEESSKSAAEAASSTSSSAEPATTSVDPLDDLEDDEMLKSSPSSSATAPEPSKPAEIPPLYSEEDLNSLGEAEAASRKWLEEKLEAQKKLKESDDPAFTVKDINEQTTKLNNVLMDMMMKKMRVPPKPKAKPKPKVKKPKKNDSKKAKAAAEKPEEEKTDQEKEAEIREALEKAGIKGDGIKINLGERKGKDGRPLVKLDLPPDASEEDIKAAIDKATREAREAKEQEEGGKEGEQQKHDEL